MRSLLLLVSHNAMQLNSSAFDPLDSIMTLCHQELKPHGLSLGEILILYWWFHPSWVHNIQSQCYNSVMLYAQGILQRLRMIRLCHGQASGILSGLLYGGSVPQMSGVNQDDVTRSWLDGNSPLQIMQQWPLMTYAIVWTDCFHKSWILITCRKVELLLHQ